MSNPDKRWIEKFEKKYLEIKVLNYKKIQQMAISLCAEVEEETVRRTREEMSNGISKISFIHADFDRNGLVRETADKINEVIEAVNKLSLLTNKK